MIYFLIAIAIALVAIILLLTVSKNTKANTKKGKLSTSLMNENEQSYVRKKFLTEKEREFFNSIESNLNSMYYLLSQVRVADLIEPSKHFKKNSKEYISLFRQISQWHVDYVIINKTNFNIELAIELDDITHSQKNRVERDKILNKAMMQAGIKLLRVNSKSEFEKLKENDKEVNNIFNNNSISKENKV
ncbi:DUF2726 domain-containing protein [Citrobacter meridianamericanus]|uniref:DUF2726 domain-containing protein n=1 Tax=Citrobacter meridianamericanus TaxID=2894201 RepID=UPI003A6C936C